MKILNLLVGGPIENWPQELKENTIEGPWIGVDRGSLRLLERGITPIVAIGDYDSMGTQEFQTVKERVKDIRRAIPEKDETDTELAVTVALNEFKTDRLDIYGATGGRLDHFLANLFLVLKDRYRSSAPKIRFIDRANTITFYLPGEYEILKEPDKKYLAFIPLTPINHLTLVDEKYRLGHAKVLYPISYASNEFVGEKGHFQFDSGVMCVIQSKDVK